MKEQAVAPVAFSTDLPVLKQMNSFYNVEQWGAGYFSVNERGNVVVNFAHDDAVEFNSMIAKWTEQNGQFPLIIRFPHIIHHRVAMLYDVFSAAIHRYGYQNGYTLVYPIKVNQQRRVLEHVVSAQDHHSNGHSGLEAGSKPELVLALAMAHNHSDIICNGYKDAQYVRLALMAQQLGHRVCLVIEKPSEVRIILEMAKIVGVTPCLGVRVQLFSQAKSAWELTSGEKAKFGLNATQLLEVIEYLRSQNSVALLQLLHVHLGSQLVSIQDIRRALKEFSQFYAELHRLGVCISCLDFGGGLAIDYEGTQSSSTYSMDYTVADYADAIVSEIASVCQHYRLPYPRIITETGRALLSHHAVLLANVLDTHVSVLPAIEAPAIDAPEVLKELWRFYSALPAKIDEDIVRSVLFQLQEKMSIVQNHYSQGTISLSQRAWVEQLVQSICRRFYQQIFPAKTQASKEIAALLSTKIADQCHVNFSLFQSVPDSWGVDQVFPVLPVSGLDQPSSRRIVVSDMTCDSEGSIMQYISEQEVTASLAIPEWSAQQPRLLAFFLVGAYQEILGSKHNLFGTAGAIEVSLNRDREIEIYQDTSAETVLDVLRSVNFQQDQIEACFLEKLDQSCLSQAQRQVLQQHFHEVLTQSTYLQGV